MPRTTTDPKLIQTRLRMTAGEDQRLRKAAEALNTTMTAILMRGLALVEAEIAKGQAPEKS